MTAPVGTEFANVAEVELVQRMVQFVGWVGNGRKLTQTGRLTLADARHLVDLLGTGDQIDPKIGGRVFRTTSSDELRELAAIVEWAKASRLVRVTSGRLVLVKKNTAVLNRPVELWGRMFEAFPRLGEALCPPGWGESLMRRGFEEAILTVLRRIYSRGGGVGLDELYTLAWETMKFRYVIEGTPRQLETWRRINDRDVRGPLEYLRQFGAVRIDGQTATGEPELVVTLTDLGRWGMRRSLGEPEPGGRVLQLRVTLAESSNPLVWRRLLVPADIRLDRLHHVIQIAMGWRNSHLHAFSVGSIQAPGRSVVYGTPDPDLEHRDESKAKLGDVVSKDGDRLDYIYDFGDSWEHEIVVEATLNATPDQRYPVCVAGEGACPPEDCGGVPGYDELRKVIADPDDDEHESMLEWMDLEKATDFDPSKFDPDEINRKLLLPV